MTTWVILFVAVLILVCTALLTDALVGFVRSFRGEEENVLNRRLSQVGSSEGMGSQLAGQNGTRRVKQAKEFSLNDWLERLIAQSGTELSVRGTLILAGCLSLVAIAVLTFVMPAGSSYLSPPLGAGVGCFSVFGYLWNRRASRVRKFEEQLPDAIDLIVRSLRVGHPLSACLSVVATELPAPISQEFGIAQYKVSYGLTVPGAFREMSERVPLPDLRYLIAALQIQEEAGGNLVESLSKLANVIRERFRMFRKIKAITAEGRLSAWLLSLFPFGIAIAVRMLRPDYYDEVLKSPDFPKVAAALVLMLIANIVVMNAITKIKV